MSENRGELDIPLLPDDPREGNLQAENETTGYLQPMQQKSKQQALKDRRSQLMRVVGLGLFVFLISLLTLSFPVFADWRPPLHLTPQDDEYSLGLLFDYLEDPSQSLTLEAVRSSKYRAAFRPSTENIPSFGFSESTYWLRVELANIDNEAEHWLLELEYPLLDNIECFLFEQNQLLDNQKSGDRIPFFARPVAGRTFIFPVDIPQGTTREILLKIQSHSSLQLPATLWTMGAFQQADHQRQVLFGLYYGIILAMLVYNLMLFASLHDPIYLYYAGYVFCFALLQASLNGLAYEYLWPGTPFWAERAIPFFIAVASLLAIQFSRSLLRLDLYYRKADTGFKVFMAVLAVGSIFAFVGEYSFVIKLATAFGLITSIALNVVGWLSWWRRIKFATYYVLAWTAFLLGSSVYALKTFTLLPDNFFTEYAIQIGSALEVLLLSLGLAYRVKLLEDDNRRIQSEATTRLEQRVIERTKELNSALDDLSIANARLEALSQTDSLTGINNRTYFDTHYRIQWKSALRESSPISILMIDVDHFKKINDSFGHPCGDKVLVELAATIAQELLRPIDFLARYGGEEFIAVLAATELTGSLVVAERIRVAVERTKIHWADSVISAQVSIGVASTTPTIGDQAEELIAQADQALYKAKLAGRNRVAVAGGG